METKSAGDGFVKGQAPDAPGQTDSGQPTGASSDSGFVKSPVQPGASKYSPDTAEPETWGDYGLGVAHSLETGLEKVPYRLAGAPADLNRLAGNVIRGGVNLVGGDMPYPTEPPIGGYEWLTSQAGKAARGLNPEDPAFQPRNESERLAQASAEAAGQFITAGASTPALAQRVLTVNRALSPTARALVSRTATPLTLPQIGGAGVAGATAGTSAQAAHDATGWGIDTLVPGFRETYPTVTRLLETGASTAAGALGGWGGTEVAQRTGLTPRPPEVQSRQELKDTGSRQYNEARALGVRYTSPAVRDLAFQHEDKLLENFASTQMPQTLSWLRQMQNLGSKTVVPLTELEGLRQRLLTLANNETSVIDPVTGQTRMTPEGKAASLTAREIHDFIENPPAEGVYEGDAQKAADLYANARGNYSAAKRAETWEGAQYRASIASNAGVDALRTQVRALLRNPKRISSFTPESRQAMEQFVRGGSLLEKGLRNVGPWVGHGGALLTGAEMIGSAIRGEAASPFMSALQAGGSEAVGQMLKHRLPDYLAERAFQKIGEGERKRSPLYQHTAPPPLSPFNTGEVARGLGALQGVVQDQDNGG